MTEKIEPTDADMQEALAQWGYNPNAISMAQIKDSYHFFVRAHARTIAQLRIAREALKRIADGKYQYPVGPAAEAVSALLMLAPIA
jgi:hypothetical protein